MRPFILASLIAIAGCTAVPTPKPRPVPRPVPTYAPPPPLPKPLPSDWRDWPYTPGDWRYRQDTRGSVAAFGLPGADATFTIRCDLSAGAMYLSRAGSAPTDTPMTIRTTSLQRTLTTQPTAATLTATLAPRDALLEAMGFSRGRFVIEQPGLPTLVLPAWAEIERVTEDCRR